MEDLVKVWRESMGLLELEWDQSGSKRRGVYVDLTINSCSDTNWRKSFEHIARRNENTGLTPMVSQRKLMIGSFTQTHEEFSINQNNNIQLPLTDWPTSLFTRLYWQVHKSNLLNFKEIIEIRNLASCALSFFLWAPCTSSSLWIASGLIILNGIYWYLLKDGVYGSCRN